MSYLPLARLGRWQQACAMTIVLLIVTVIAAMHLGIALGIAPDTHAERTRFDDYLF